MSNTRTIFAARFLLLIPAFLFLLMLHQLYVAYTVHRVWETGIEAHARIVEAEVKNMISQSHARLRLQIFLPDSTVLERGFTLPVTLIAELQQDASGLRVKVRPPDTVVIEPLYHTQLRMALINAAIAGLGAVLSLWAILAYLRFLRQQTSTQSS